MSWRRRQLQNATIHRVFPTAAAIVLSACTPMHSTIGPLFPYHGSEYDEVEIQRIAESYCDNAGEFTSVQQPVSAYTSDGCSVFPDGTWLECCVEHDIKYWCGGPLDRRLAADRALKQCVAAKSKPAAAELVFLGTRLGGWPRIPFGWRWGYGHPWPHREDPESKTAD